MYQSRPPAPLAAVPMACADDDESLIARSQTGDEAAIRALVARHAPIAFRIAYRMVGSRDQAEDIAQDVLTRMLSYRDGWRSTAGFQAWLRRAVMNRTIDVHRRGRLWLPGGLDEVGDVAHHDPAADDALNTRRTEQLVAQAVLRLPARQRAAITLCFYERLSLNDAAAALGTTAGAVESLLHRAKGTLKQDLRGLHEEG